MLFPRHTHHQNLHQGQNLQASIHYHQVLWNQFEGQHEVLIFKNLCWVMWLATHCHPLHNNKTTMKSKGDTNIENVMNYVHQKLYNLKHDIVV